jgi:hypothetical protein
MRVTGAIFHKCGGDHTKLIDEDILAKPFGS